MQATKAYATEGISVITDGEYDLKSATVDAAVSAGTSLIFDAGIKKGVSALDKKLTPPKIDSDSSAGLDAMNDAAASTVKNKFVEATGKVVHGTNVVLGNKSTSKIVGKAVKDPIKEGMDATVNFAGRQIDKLVA